MTRLEWRSPRYNTGDGEVWDLHDMDANLINWRIRGRITYLGLTRAANWADRMQQWRIDRPGGNPPPTMIEAKSVEEAKATALAILVLTN